ncbi:hypothetical protein EDC96DRAFT_503898 [Choanephora cucurbitarum]|nr:hypothetical protein EDC96DRAFT_503898 [Choanephora cucurbitarum]
MAQQIERNQEATIYIGNLDERCTESLVWELMLQAGPVVNVHLPKDRVTQTHQSYGFVEFLTEEDADYAIKIMNQVRLYGKPVRVNKATSDKKNLDVGATLFIGNLDPEVDEKMLYDTFSAFGLIVNTPKISRDPETGLSKGFGFVSFDNFESSDAAIDSMEGQYLMNKQITVSYAFKKDGKGERHGSAAERLLAAEGRKNVQMPNRLYAGGPAMAPAANAGTNTISSYPGGMNGFRPPPPPAMGAAAGYPMGYSQAQYATPPPPPPVWQ